MNPDRVMAMLARIARVTTSPFVVYDIRGGACAPHVRVGVIAVNHRSLFDVVAGLVGLHHFERYPRLLIAEKYVTGRWTGAFARSIGAIPVPAEGRRDDAMRAGIEALRRGVPLLVMPEGRLHHDPNDRLSTAEARPGVSRLAIGASTVVVTAGLQGTEAVWPSTSRLPRLNPWRRKIVIVRVSDAPLVLHGEDHRSNAELVMADIRKLLAMDPDPTVSD